MLDFERPVADLQEKINGLKATLQTLPQESQGKIQEEIERMDQKAQRILHDIYKTLTPWQKVQVARHPERPKTTDYIHGLISNFISLKGDRCFADDTAIKAGIGLFRGMPVMVMGHEKGHDTQSRLAHNFGMAHPEGYRKACRLMKLAERMGFAILTFVDTPGAYAGTQAEERGQSQAIAECIDVSLNVTVPMLSVIIGEGGSGGAVAFTTANTVMMLEHSVYSVISPEGCASILWRTAEKKEEAAIAQKLTAQDLMGFQIIDRVIPEPLGGAHRHKKAAVDYVGDALYEGLLQMKNNTKEKFHHLRRQRFLEIGKKFVKYPGV